MIFILVFNHLTVVLYSLGLVLLRNGQTTEALEQFREAVRLAPDDPQTRDKLATTLIEQNRTAEAVEQYRAIIRLRPDSVPPLVRLAMLLATHPDPAIRNGDQAVKLAQRASQLTSDSDAAVLDSLAAAYAETGQFERAEKTAARALPLARAAGQNELAWAIHQRLSLYKQGKPARQRPAGASR